MFFWPQITTTNEWPKSKLASNHKYSLQARQRRAILVAPFAGLKLDRNWLKNTVQAELLCEKNTVPAGKKKPNKPNMG